MISILATLKFFFKYCTDLINPFKSELDVMFETKRLSQKKIAQPNTERKECEAADWGSFDCKLIWQFYNFYLCWKAELSRNTGHSNCCSRKALGIWMTCHMNERIQAWDIKARCKAMRVMIVHSFVIPMPSAVECRATAASSSQGYEGFCLNKWFKTSQAIVDQQIERQQMESAHSHAILLMSGILGRLLSNKKLSCVSTRIHDKGNCKAVVTRSLLCVYKLDTCITVNRC